MTNMKKKNIGISSKKNLSIELYL